MEAMIQPTFEGYFGGFVMLKEYARLAKMKHRSKNQTAHFILKFIICEDWLMAEAIP